MAHVFQINGTTQRRGAVSAPNEAGSGLFRPYGVENAAASPAVDGAGLSAGFAQARPASSTDFSRPTSGNAAASVVLAAPGVGRSHAVHGVDFGYASTPSNGLLTVTDGTTTYQVPVTSAGPGPIDFRPPLVFAANAQVSGSLSAGGAGVSGWFGFTGRSVV